MESIIREMEKMETQMFKQAAFVICYLINNDGKENFLVFDSSKTDIAYFDSLNDVMNSYNHDAHIMDNLTAIYRGHEDKNEWSMKIVKYVQHPLSFDSEQCVAMWIYE